MRLIGRRWALSGSVAGRWGGGWWVRGAGDVSSPAALSSPDMRSENRARDLANPKESTKLRGITGKADWFQYRRPRGRSLSGNDITLQLRSGRAIRRHPRRRQPPPPSAHTPWKVVASHPVQSALFDYCPSLWHLAAACEEYSDERSVRALPSQKRISLESEQVVLRQIVGRSSEDLRSFSVTNVRGAKVLFLLLSTKEYGNTQSLQLSRVVFHVCNTSFPTRGPYLKVFSRSKRTCRS
ncbi:hypothetical protein PCL_08421 [Purpureocillium lilacinum]|uniref:Uncharacterized protein n=1 Tax=Purpureocillium lilacinum TaxID=33203 RepID=A0A2U3DRT3_PURLI|nr:hypothetical protein PCL_08421 [Purpureocillium lilacinum]